MIEAFVSILVWLIVLGVLFYCAKLLIGVVPMDAGIKAAVMVILQVIIVLCILAAVLQVFGLYDAGLPIVRHWR